MRKIIDKKQLIEYCYTMKDFSCAIKNDNSKGNGVEISQFRELAIACKSCDTFEEAQLLVKYKIATDHNYTSWGFDIGDGKTIGKAVLDKISRIRSDYDDDAVLNALSLFFGYLFRSAVIWKSGIYSRESDNSISRSMRTRCEDSGFYEI